MNLFLIEAPFSPKIDFWIFLVIGIGGLVFSVLSFVQARGAKIAAQQAGNIVKIQDVLLDISEIINICQLNFSDDYQKASIRVNEISGKINYIIGVITNETNIQADLITEISKTLSTIRETLNKLNPSISPPNLDLEKLNGTFFYAIEPHLGSLSAQMNLLSGYLHSNIINT